MRKLRSRVQPWLKENPQADIAELEKAFGTPEAIAVAYLDEMPPKEILTKLSEKRKTVAVVAVALTLAVAIWATVLIAAAVSLQQDTAEGPIFIKIEEKAEAQYP